MSQCHYIMLLWSVIAYPSLSLSTWWIYSSPSSTGSQLNWWNSTSLKTYKIQNQITLKQALKVSNYQLCVLYISKSPTVGFLRSTWKKLILPLSSEVAVESWADLDLECWGANRGGNDFLAAVVPELSPPFLGEGNSSADFDLCWLSGSCSVSAFSEPEVSFSSLER